MRKNGDRPLEEAPLIAKSQGDLRAMLQQRIEVLARQHAEGRAMRQDLQTQLQRLSTELIKIEGAIEAYQQILDELPTLDVISEKVDNTSEGSGDAEDTSFEFQSERQARSARQEADR